MGKMTPKAEFEELSLEEIRGAFKECKGSISRFAVVYRVSFKRAKALIYSRGLEGIPRGRKFDKAQTEMYRSKRFKIYLSCCVEAGRILDGPLPYRTCARKWFIDSGFDSCR